MSKAIGLADLVNKFERNIPAIGVFIAGDPRIDEQNRQRCRNIVKIVADVLAERVKLPDGTPARVVVGTLAYEVNSAACNALLIAPADYWRWPLGSDRAVDWLTSHSPP